MGCLILLVLLVCAPVLPWWAILILLVAVFVDV